MGYGLDGPGVQDFSLLNSIQIDSGVHPTSYPMGMWGSFPMGLSGRAGEADHSPTYLYSAEVKKGGAIPPLSHMSS
jgi:hypothetical protein